MMRGWLLSLVFVACTQAPSQGTSSTSSSSGAAASSSAAESSSAGPVNIQILAINDFHGNLEPPTGSNGKINLVDAGGAAHLAAHLNALKSQNPNTIIVSAGDLI